MEFIKKFRFIKQIKYLVLKWVINENLYRAFMHCSFPKIQKFWFGKPSLSAPALEKSYFESCGLTSNVVRRLDDYRPAAIIRNNNKFSLDHCLGFQSIEFAISPAYRYDGRSGRSVKVRIGGAETCIYDIAHDQWHDVRLDVSGKDRDICIETNAPIAITMPKGVNCDAERKHKRKVRHIVLLVLDAWTTAVANKVHPFTSESSSIPNIDRFFDKGLKALNGVSSGQWTLPAVGSLFTGLHLARHRMFHPRRWQEFDKKRRLLPEYFQHKGYHTLCGSVVSRVTPAFGHNRGFDRFLYHFAEPHISYQQYNPAIWIQEIISHLETYHNDRTFSYFQFPDTHPSWDIATHTRYFQLGRRGSTSANIKEMMNSKNSKDLFDLPEQASQIYLLKLMEIDRMFGAIFSYVEDHFGDEAMVVVTADHGLRMPYLPQKHKEDEPFLTDVRVNIPLYIRGGDVSKSTYEDLCSPNVDLPIMLLNAAGIKPDFVDLDGLDLCSNQVSRKAVISEYIYDGIYEIAVRGYGHALFLKYKIDDINFKLLSKDPFYKALYKLNESEYSPKDNLLETNPEIVDNLQKAACDHFQKTGFQKILVNSCKAQDNLIKV